MELSHSLGAASYAAIQEFPKVFGTRRFITVFTRPSIGPCPEACQSSPHYPILSKIHLILSHLRLGLSVELYPSGFPTKIILGWYNRSVSGRRTKWTQSHPTLQTPGL
jgi:hypothetical protein